MAFYVGWLRQGRRWHRLIKSPDEMACWHHLNCQPSHDRKGRPRSKVVLLDGVEPIGKEEVKSESA